MTGRAALFLSLAAVAIAALAPSGAAQSADAPRPAVVFFYQDGCPDCVQIGEVLDLLALDLPPGGIARYEIGTKEGRTLFLRLQKAYGIDVQTVPLVFIGDRVISGAGRIQELTLSDAIGDCAQSPCPSPLDRLPPDVFPWVDLAQLGLLTVAIVLFLLLQRP